jgi:hypothetical protein
VCIGRQAWGSELESGTGLAGHGASRIHGGGCHDGAEHAQGLGKERGGRLTGETLWACGCGYRSSRVGINGSGP